MPAATAISFKLAVAAGFKVTRSAATVMSGEMPASLRAKSGSKNPT
jgi:hypothetical protein